MPIREAPTPGQHCSYLRSQLDVYSPHPPLLFHAQFLAPAHFVSALSVLCICTLPMYHSCIETVPSKYRAPARPAHTSLAARRCMPPPAVPPPPPRSLPAPAEPGSACAASRACTGVSSHLAGGKDAAGGCHWRLLGRSQAGRRRAQANWHSNAHSPACTAQRAAPEDVVKSGLPELGWLEPRASVTTIVLMPCKGREGRAQRVSGKLRWGGLAAGRLLSTWHHLQMTSVLIPAAAAAPHPQPPALLPGRSCSAAAAGGEAAPLKCKAGREQQWNATHAGRPAAWAAMALKANPLVAAQRTSRFRRPSRSASVRPSLLRPLGIAAS